MEQTLEHRLREALSDLPPEDVHAVVEFAQFLSHKRHAGNSNGTETELSEAEHTRIIRVLDTVAELSAEAGPPVNNRDHDRYLYGGN